MKFLIIGDLHGNKPEIYFKNFDAIIAPGDFCSDAPRKYMFEALTERLKNPKSKITWYDLVGKKEARKMVEKSIADGRTILEYLNSFNVPVYALPGNWDWTGTDREYTWSYLQRDRWKDLIKGLKNVIDLHHKRIDIGDFEVIGHGIISGPEYPQTKEDLDRYKNKPKELARIKKDYEQQVKKVNSLFDKAKKSVIFLSHNVPYNTAIDQINNPASPRNGQHFGSVIAKDTIKKYQPLVCIGGHMHEHFTSVPIGKTIAINAGFGSYVNVFLELEGKTIKKLEFHKEKTI